MNVTVTFGEVIAAPVQAPRAQTPWGWFHIPHPDPSVMEIHMLPGSDVGYHAFDIRCACGCEEDPHAPGFFHHKAFDGREDYESGKRKHN